MARARELNVLIGALSLFSVACGWGSGGGEQLRSIITRSGDTTVVMNHGKPPQHRIDSITIIWRSPDLEDPRTLLTVGGSVIVGDRTRLHFLTQRGELLVTVGREGKGPREFDYVAAVAQFGSDTIAVHDSENQRLSFFTPGGDYLGSARVSPPLPYGNAVNGYLPEYWVRRGLVRLRGGVVSLWRERIPWTRPTRTALVWHDLQADTSAVLESWDGEQFFRAGGRYAATTRLFGPRVIAALSRDGTLAVGNGVDYCIQLHGVMDGAFRKVCRDRAPVPVGAGIRHPDLSRAKNDFRRQWLATILREQEISKNLPQFDRLLLDEQHRLWVRTVGPEFSDIHPYLLEDAPEMAPSHRSWDVFDKAGRLLATIQIPAHFTPQVLQSGRIYGFAELPTGEVGIALISIPL